MGRAARRKRPRIERRPRLCLGCGARARLTREHIVAQWLRREFERDTDEGPGRWLSVSGDAHQSQTEDFARFDIAGDLLCQACNTGWSSSLERQVKEDALSLIRTHAEPMLPVLELQMLSAWLAKMAVLSEFVAGQLSEGFARALIAPIATNSTASADVRVWLGSLLRHRYFRQGSWRMAIAGGVVQAIAAGDLLSLVVLPSESSPQPASFAAHPEAFVQAWPASAPKSWPPARRVSIEQLNRAFSVSPRID